MKKYRNRNQFCSTTDGRTNGKYYLTEFVSSSVKQYESLKWTLYTINTYSELKNKTKQNSNFYQTITHLQSLL